MSWSQILTTAPIDWFSSSKPDSATAESDEQAIPLNPSTPPDWFHAGQLKAWHSDQVDTVVVAGTQGGKTAMQAPWLLREIRRCAPLIRWRGRSGKFIYAGPTLTLMEIQAIPAFDELFVETHQLGTLIKGNKPKFTLSPEGSRALLGFNARVTVHFAYTKDSSNLESMTAMAGVWDEAGQKENKQASYRAYNRRLKGARSTTFRMAFDWLVAQGLTKEFQWWIDEFYQIEGPYATFGRRLWGTTPYEWGWFKTQVVDRAERKEPGFAHYNFPTWLNPTVSKEECEQELSKGMPHWEWQMMYEGLFTKPAGIIYDCFDPDSHTMARFDIPEKWLRHVGIDFGNVNTAAVKIAEEEDGEGKKTGRLILYSSYAKRTDDIPEHARALKAKEPRTLTGVGGSHQESGWRQAYRAEGISISDPLQNVREVEIGIQCVYGAVKRGELVILDDLHDVIDQFLQYSRELDDNGDPTEKIANKATWHFMDAIRYIVSRLRPPLALVDPNAMKPFRIRL